MRLFDDIERTATEKPAPGQRAFDYLNQTARPDFSCARESLESWFWHYPTGEQPRLRADFRAAADWNHNSAFFELVLHELLLRLGCQVELHPTIPGSSRHPDFLAHSPDGSGSYVEAVLAAGETRKETLARRRIDQVYATLAHLKSPDYWLGLSVDGVPETQPKGSKIRSCLEAALATLDYESARRQYEAKGIDGMPHWCFKHDGWTLIASPIPKSREERGNLGVHPFGTVASSRDVSKADEQVKRSIIGKAHAYGRLDSAYIIAINVTGARADKHDMVDALFGSLQVSMPADGAPRVTRAADGVWSARYPSRNDHISAVLAVEHLSPWNLPHAGACLYQNPSAAWVYCSGLTRLPGLVLVDSTLEWVPGQAIAALLGLPAEWPQDCE